MTGTPRARGRDEARPSPRTPQKSGQAKEKETPICPMPPLTLRQSFPMAVPMASQQRGQRRTSRVRDLRRCPHDGHLSHSKFQVIRGILCGAVPTLHLPESEKSSTRAQGRMSRMRGIRPCAHWIAEEEAFGTHGRSVSAGIGQIGVCFGGRCPCASLEPIQTQSIPIPGGPGFVRAVSAGLFWDMTGTPRSRSRDKARPSPGERSFRATMCLENVWKATEKPNPLQSNRHPAPPPSQRAGQPRSTAAAGPCAGKPVWARGGNRGGARRGAGLRTGTGRVLSARHPWRRRSPDS